MTPSYTVISKEGQRIRYRTETDKWSLSAKDARAYSVVDDARAVAQRRHIDNALVVLSWEEDAASEAVEGK